MSIFQSQKFALILSSLARIRYKISGGYSVFNKIFLLSLVVVALGWYYFDNIATLLINDKTVKETLIKSLSKASGKGVEVNGSVIFTTKPEPYVVINDIILVNQPQSYSKNFVEINEVSTKPDLAGLLRGKIAFDELTLKNTKIFFESSSENTAYKALQTFFSSGTDYSGKKLIFKNLEIYFVKKSPIQNSQKNIIRKISLAELTLDPSPEGGGYSIKGLTNKTDSNESYVFSINFKDGIGGPSEILARLYSNDTEINFSGNADTSEALSFSGNFEGKIKSFSYKFFSELGFSNDITDAIQLNEDAKIKGELGFNKSEILVKNLSVESEIIKLLFNNVTEISDFYTSEIKLSVPYLNYKKLFKTRKEQIAIRKVETIEKDFNKRLKQFPLFSIGDDINYKFSFNLDEIDFYGEEKGDLSFASEYNNNLFTLDKFEANLPGNSHIRSFAKIQADKANKRMAGELAFAIYGANLDKLSFALGTIDDAKNSPGLGIFFLKTKGYFYDKKIHFKEIISKINDNRFAGQMIVDYTKNLQASAAFNFDKLEIDRYLIEEKDDNYHDSFSEKIDFLRFVDSVFDELRILVNSSNLTKSGENLRNFELIAEIKPGITKINKLFFDTYKYGEFLASAAIDINDFQPIIDANIRIQKLDYDYIKFGKTVGTNDFYDFDGNWSESPITFEDLGYVEGKVKIAIDSFKYNNLNIESLRLALNMQGNKVEIEDSKLELFGSQFNFKGWLTTEYPSFAISFVSSNINSNRFLKNIFGIDEIFGQFNLSSTITSTGYNLRQMVKDAKGRIELGTNGFKVLGFDLVGLSDGIVEAKKIEDAKQIGMGFLNSGETEFTGFKSSFGINEGKLFFNEVKLNSPRGKFQAKITGGLDLLNWNNQTKSNFDVRSLDGISIPLVLVTTGKIAKQSLKWNEEVFSKYWEERFYSGR